MKLLPRDRIETTPFRCCSFLRFDTATNIATDGVTSSQVYWFFFRVHANPDVAVLHGIMRRKTFFRFAENIHCCDSGHMGFFFVQKTPLGLHVLLAYKTSLYLSWWISVLLLVNEVYERAVYNRI